MKRIITSIALSGAIFGAYAQSGFVWTDISAVTSSSSTNHNFYILPLDNNTILGATAAGIFKSSDNGQNWNEMPGSGHSMRIVRLSTGKLVAAGTSVRVSSDNGDTWTSSTSGLPSVYARDLFVDNNDNVYLSNDQGAMDKKGLYKSSDGGVSWNKLDTIGLNIISGSAVMGGIYTETGDTVFLGYRDKLFKSVDGGNTWSAVSGISNSVHRIRKAPDGNLFVATSSGLFVSSNGGDNFTKKTSFITPDVVFKGDTVIVLQRGQGKGHTVIRYNLSDLSQIDVIGDTASGIKNVNVIGMSMNDAGNLFVASETVGAATGNQRTRFYTTAPAGSTATGINETLAENVITVYPNPANNVVTIANIPTNSTVRITDVAGKTVYSSKNADAQVISSVDGWMSGIYFVQVVNNNSIITKKLIIN